MADETVTLVEKTLGVADDILRNSFAGKDLPYLIVAIAPDGAAVIRSNCEPEMLRHLAGRLIAIADQHTGPPSGERN
jgi:hypothetical protein